MAAQLPSPPQDPTLVSSTSTTINFDWFDPENDGGSPITDFQVYWNSGDDKNPFVLLQSSTLGMNTLFIQSGLTPGNYYQFKLRARNYVGLSPFSRFVRIIAASIPKPPINLQSAGSTTSSVTFTWNPNSDNGGASVFDYAVYWDGGNANLPLSQFTEAHDTTYNLTTFTESDLTKGSYYRFAVQAQNDAGHSDFSSIIRLLSAVVNTEPLDLRMTYQDELSIRLAWNMPAIDVGSAVTNYLVSRYIDSTSSWLVIGSTQLNEFNVNSGLTTGVFYTFAVQAQNEIGLGAYSQSVRVIAAKVADPPTLF